MARTIFAALRGHCDRYYARSLFFDNVAGWILEIERGQALPLRKLQLADRQGEADELGEQERRIAQEGHDERAGMDSKSAKGQQKKSKARMKSFEKDRITKIAHANLVERINRYPERPSTWKQSDPGVELKPLL